MVVCNTRCLQTKITGVQRYTIELLKHFPQGEVESVFAPDRIARGMLGHVWEQTVLPLKLKKRLLWSPSNTGPLFVSNQIVTIHDIVPIDHPEWVNKAFAKCYQFVLPRLVKKAKHLITISNFSKERIIEAFDVPESKISVVYNGVHSERLQSDSHLRPVVLPFKRFILSLGSLEPRKNLSLLFKAWKSVQARLPEDIGLIVVGRMGNPKVFGNYGIGDIPDRVAFLGHLSDEEIAFLYKNAIFFVYLSSYEGFGLPPLEAMAAGTPVLTGNRTSLPEVVGESAVMIDPFSQTECESAIIRLVADDELRKTLAMKGKVQSSKFSWNKAAAETWQILQEHQL